MFYLVCNLCTLKCTNFLKHIVQPVMTGINTCEYWIFLSLLKVSLCQGTNDNFSQLWLIVSSLGVSCKYTGHILLYMAPLTQQNVLRFFAYIISWIITDTFSFWYSVSHSPDSPQTHYVAKNDLDFLIIQLCLPCAGITAINHVAWCMQLEARHTLCQLSCIPRSLHCYILLLYFIFVLWFIWVLPTRLQALKLLFNPLDLLCRWCGKYCICVAFIG